MRISCYDISARIKIPVVVLITLVISEIAHYWGHSCFTNTSCFIKWLFQLFISLLSTSTVKSKYCQDEVALAYISQKAIFPVAIQSQEEIYSIMDTGMWVELIILWQIMYFCRIKALSGISELKILKWNQVWCFYQFRNIMFQQLFW